MSLGKFFMVCMVGLMLMIIIANAPARTDQEQANQPAVTSAQ
jgi:hypothetical protein